MPNALAVNGSELRVNANGPNPVVRLAKWIKNSTPPAQRLKIISSKLLSLSGQIAGLDPNIAKTLEVLAQLCWYKIEGYTIVIAGYLSATAQAGVEATGHLRTDRT